VLGWLGEGGLAGGAVRLDREAARLALYEQVAKPLGLDVATAAYGAVEVATASMIRAIRAVSSERGRDPRDFTLVAFGGNGGMFGPLVARSLGMRRVIVPPSPGLFSAAGLLDAVVEHQASRTHKTLLAEADADTVEHLFQHLAREVTDRLADAGVADTATLRRQARLRYHGQSFELTVMVERFDSAAIAEAFAAEHERSYGHRADAAEPVELVSLVVVGRGRARESEPGVSAVHAAVAGGSRRAYFGAHGWHDVPLIGRADLSAAARRGPLIIEEYDATIVSPPDTVAWRDAGGNVTIDLDG
jgi:N-methylhydantoinase A